MDALRISGLKKTYPGPNGGVEALKGVDLVVPQGDFYALLGANGAGKTTLINTVVSLVRKTAGSVEVFGVDIDKDHDAAKAQIGIVPQEWNVNIFEKVFDIVVTQAGYYGMSRADASVRAEEVLRDCGLWEKKDANPLALSGGMKRRLMIARALVHKPKLLLLDEPTAGVDVELRRGMWDYLRKLNAEGMTILLTTHYLEEVQELCRAMTIVQKGLVVKSGGVKQLLAEAEGKHFRLTLAAAPTEAQVKAIGAEKAEGDEIVVGLHKGDSLDALFARAREAGVSVLDVAPAQNRIEELYLSTLKS